MKTLNACIKDYSYMISTGALMYLRHTPPKHYLDYVIEGKAPIIILPGLFGRWSFYKSMTDYISMLGHPIYTVPKLGNNIWDIPLSSKKVVEIIESNNLKNVIILAHSKGGLIGKYLLACENQENRIKGLITISTPFQGSPNAKFIPLDFVQELSPDSKIICYLENHREVNNRIVSIIPLYDNCVRHSQGGYLEGAMQNIKVEASGHSLVLKNKIVWQHVIKWIEKIARS